MLIESNKHIPKARVVEGIDQMFTFGFEIKVVPHNLISKGQGLLLIHPDNIKK